jgi:hypothetical protein
MPPGLWQKKTPQGSELRRGIWEPGRARPLIPNFCTSPGLVMRGLVRLGKCS